MAQATRLLVLQGYLTRAREPPALKQLEHRISRYWRLENLWSNCASGADTIPRDNIMFTGFLATKITLYRAASGPSRFEDPGGLVFRHPLGETYG